MSFSLKLFEIDIFFHFYFIGGGMLFHITKRAMVKKDYKELDEAIKAKIQPFLYNGGKGKMVPIAQLSMLRNRDRSKSKQVRLYLDWSKCYKTSFEENS